MSNHISSSHSSFSTSQSTYQASLHFSTTIPNSNSSEHHLQFYHQDKIFIRFSFISHLNFHFPSSSRTTSSSPSTKLNPKIEIEVEKHEDISRFGTFASFEGELAEKHDEPKPFGSILGIRVGGGSRLAPNFDTPYIK